MNSIKVRGDGNIGSFDLSAQIRTNVQTNDELLMNYSRIPQVRAHLWANATVIGSKIPRVRFTPWVNNLPTFTLRSSSFYDRFMTILYVQYFNNNRNINFTPYCSLNLCKNSKISVDIRGSISFKIFSIFSEWDWREILLFIINIITCSIRVMFSKTSRSFESSINLTRRTIEYFSVNKKHWRLWKIV